MSISRSEIEKIAALARLALTEDEKDHITKDLSEILEYVGRISVLAGSALEDPAAGDGAGRAETPLRDDVIIPSLSVEEALRPSADHDASFFRVPPVIER